jgi:hypothetical protein
MSKTFPKKSTEISMSVFPRLFFVLSRFRVFLIDGSSKTLQKRFTCYKQIVSIFFFLTKKSTKNLEPIFSVVFPHVVAFLGEGSPIEKINPALALFGPLTRPPSRPPLPPRGSRVADFFVCRPLAFAFIKLGLFTACRGKFLPRNAQKTHLELEA